MNYLSYQPAFDVFHTEFRFLRLRRLMSADAPWQYQQLRIADFYLLFFFRLRDVRLAPKHRALKKLAEKKAAQRYEHQPDDRLVFNRMAPIHLVAAGTLAAKHFFDADSLSSGLMLEADAQEPELLAERIDEANSAETDVMEAIQTLIADYELLGPNGLKARTGLMEHRYDTV